MAAAARTTASVSVLAQHPPAATIALECAALVALMDERCCLPEAEAAYSVPCRSLHLGAHAARVRVEPAAAVAAA